MKLHALFIIIIGTIHSLAMEPEIQSPPSSVFFTISGNDKREFPIQKHFFENSEYLQDLYENATEGQFNLYQEHFTGFSFGTPSATLFISSLNEEYNTVKYFDFFINNTQSINDLYRLYTWYDFISYPQICTIICASIIKKACTSNIISPKKFIEFTVCKTHDYHSLGNFKRLYNIQKKYNKILVDSIFTHIQKKLISNNSLKTFQETLQNIVNTCTCNYNDGLNDNLLCPSVLKNEKTPIDLPFAGGATQNKSNYNPMDLDAIYKKLHEHLSELSTKIVWLTDMRIDTNCYHNNLVFLFHKYDCSSIVLHNVCLVTHSKSPSYFLKNLRTKKLAV